MAHTQVGKYSCLVLSDGRVMDGADLREFIGVDEVEGGMPNEFARFKPCRGIISDKEELE